MISQVGCPKFGQESPGNAEDMAKLMPRKMSDFGCQISEDKPLNQTQALQGLFN